VGGAFLLLIVLPCAALLPWSSDPARYGDAFSASDSPFAPPSLDHPLGTDELGRSLLWRCALGGAISLTVGLSAAAVAVVIGVTWGSLAGYAGGRIDAGMMRIVDVIYGLPSILLVLLLAVAVNGVADRHRHGVLRARSDADARATQARAGLAAARAAGDAGAIERAATEERQAEQEAQRWREKPGLAFRLSHDRRWVLNLATLTAAIGGVSWLTMSRVIRGQVLSLRAQPFIEAARAVGVGRRRMLRVHLLPNLLGPIIVYTTLAVPQAILQESFLSFLTLGVQPPLPSWGSLSSDALKQMHTLLPGATGAPRWWPLLWPCLLLGGTLLSLNLVGDALRERYDPRSRRRT
jgi:ABC-type dipeptide/oligopeptide/nickel transport system permease subunit